MTAEIIAERLTDRTCEKHPDSLLVEVLLRSDQLKNDWVLAICPVCHAESNQDSGPDDA